MDFDKRSQPNGRVEDSRLLRGSGTFVDDINFENVAYLGIVRSPYANANIRRIDFSAASKSSDFIASLTGRELQAFGVSPLVQYALQKPVSHHHLSIFRAQYVGQAVAALLARSRYAVEDLIDKVEVEYEELPVITTIEEAKRNNPLMFEHWNENVALTAESKRGEADVAIRSAACVVRKKMGIRRQTAAPIEPRAVIAKFNSATEVYDVYATTQSANRSQNYLSQELNISKEKIHVIVKDVGGSFGSKGAQSSPEYAIACVFSRMTGLPVKWVSTRFEDLIETAPGRDEYCDIELACTADGKIVALRAKIEADVGISGTTSVMANLTLKLIVGAYNIPNLDLKATAYVTNKAASGPVRGAGRPEACFFIERAVDDMARELKIDPLEFRRKNIIQPQQFPYDNGSGFIYDSANFPAILDVLEKSCGYSDMIQWKNRFNQLSIEKNSNEIAGLGICIEIEDSGAQFSEMSSLVMNPEGDFKLFTGSSPHGQGLETTLAQLVSEELNVPLEKIRIIYGDTTLIPTGTGTFGSRSITAGGSAAIAVSRKLRELLEVRASSVMKDKVTLDFRNGLIHSSQKSMTMAALFAELGLTEISEHIDFKLSGLTFASGAHLCAMILDLETGKITIKKYVAVDDAGRIINKAIVDGQIHGGVVHGIGGAIFEELRFDSNGNPLTTSFMDYLLPSSLESPNVEVYHVETVSEITLNGSRGVGESGTMAAYPTVFNALNDALSVVGKSGLDFAPATPDAVYFRMSR